MRRALTVLVALLTCSVSSLTAGVAAFWSAPRGKVAAGSQVEITRCVVNEGSVESRINVPNTLPARVRIGGFEREVTLLLISGDRSVVAPSGFVVHTYRIDLPAGVSGEALLDISEGAERLAFEVTSSTGIAAGSSGGGSLPPAVTPGQPSEPAIAAFQRSFTDRFSTHNPIYFIFGPDKPAAKFQFSFKYRLLDDSDNLASAIPALHALHFGYTQRSIWDITSNSSPFYDTSYMPELMFEWLTPRESPSFFQWLGLQAGVQHESNGRDGIFSRSLNQVYLRPMLSLGHAGDWAIIFSPRFILDVDPLDDNPDLRRYRGNVEYTLMLTKNDNLSVKTTARAGNRWDKFSVQVDVNYPLRVKYGNFATFLVLQYWDGYGESLLGYNRKSQTIRAGFGLVR